MNLLVVLLETSNNQQHQASFWCRYLITANAVYRLQLESGVLYSQLSQPLLSLMQHCFVVDHALMAAEVGSESHLRSA